MKKFKVLSLLFVAIVSCFIFSGCTLSFGVYDLEFILPDGTIHYVHTYGPNDSLITTISAPSIIGYNFVGWSETKNLQSVIQIPYSIKTNKLYAKYEIDEDMFYTYSSINYNGGTQNLNMTKILQNKYYILIKDQSLFDNISSIQIVANNSDFIASHITLRDANAKIVASSNNQYVTLNLLNDFESNYTGNFVLEVDAFVNADFTIIVS